MILLSKQSQMRLIHPVNNGMQISIICMEHALHLAAKHFVKVVGPTDNDADKEHDNKYEVADIVGKALALITQSIRFTSHPKLVSSSTNVVVRQMSLPLSFSSGFGLTGPPYSTCWSECCTYERFIQLTDDSDEVPKLHSKSYSDFKLSGQEWLKLELM
ncbi:hypothetical protein BDR05DRAFT_946935 [Suillus weaverae]|nr:hypothetical protein BDR05DRAFT_946935 [Suillus weaverae]